MAVVRLRGARVWNPEDLGVVDVIVGGGTVLAIGDDLGDWPVPTVDLGGHTLIPGLVDVHVHLCGGGGEGGAETRIPPVTADRLVAGGVTTAVGLLGTDATTRSLGELLAAARAVEAQGLTAWCYTGSYQVPPPTLTGSVRGDIVHVDRMVAVGELAISDHRSSQPTFEELIRVGADAHVAGMMARKAGLVHLHLGDGPRGLSLIARAMRETELPARTWHPTHCNRNPDLLSEAIELAAEGLPIDLSAFPPDEDDDITAAEGLLRYLDAGGAPEGVTVSSDTGGCLPTFDDDGHLLHMDVGGPAGLLDCLRDALKAGIPPAQAVAPLTSNPARLYRFDGKGEIAVGADADLCVLDAHLALVGVMAGGRWMRDPRAAG